MSARESWTRQEAWDWGAARLRAAGIAADDARVEAAVLLRHAAAISREELLIRPATPLPLHVARAYAALIRERAAGRPTAYLVGHREFFGLDLLVDGRVLIPRPETERLVEVVRAAAGRLPAPLIVDVGTGSGAIAIALASALPGACLIATDVSGDALEVARLNARRHGVGARITWLRGEALAPLAPLGLDGRVDAIVSNPPYIPTGALAELPLEVRGYEPRRALDGGPDGLAVHRRIVAEAPRYLRTGRVLALEVAAVPGQSRAVARLIDETGAYARPEIVRDYAGMERVVVATRGESRADHRG